MKKICKVKPNYPTCHMCLDMQMTFNVVEDCSKCELNTREYELLQIGTSFWSGNYAMVQYNGEIEKVSLSRVYDIREVE